MAALHISQEGRAADTLGAAVRRPLPQFHPGSRRRFRRYVEFRDRRTESAIDLRQVSGEYRPTLPLPEVQCRGGPKLRNEKAAGFEQRWDRWRWGRGRPSTLPLSL
jgi:hypothetical protein